VVEQTMRSLYCARMKITAFFKALVEHWKEERRLQKEINEVGIIEHCRRQKIREDAMLNESIEIGSKVFAHVQDSAQYVRDKRDRQ